MRIAQAIFLIVPLTLLTTGTLSAFGQTSDPLLNQQFKKTDEVLAQADAFLAQNAEGSDKVKDQTFDPPRQSQQKLYMKCGNQATEMGLNPQNHCNSLFSSCSMEGLTYDECYVLNFLAPNVSYPEELKTSLNQKLDAAVAAGQAENDRLDSIMPMMKDFYERQGESLKSTACMPYCD
jgi:hypothetical protein